MCIQEKILHVVSEKGGIYFIFARLISYGHVYREMCIKNRYKYIAFQEKNKSEYSKKRFSALVFSACFLEIFFSLLFIFSSFSYI